MDYSKAADEMMDASLEKNNSYIIIAILEKVVNYHAKVNLFLLKGHFFLF
jgi:hypothetical protein